MLNESSGIAVSTAQATVGLTAFQVAVVQAKVFVKTLEEATDRKEQEARAQAQKSAEQRQKIRESLAKKRGGVDIVVDNSESAASATAKTSEPAPEQKAKGKEVNIEI